MQAYTEKLIQRLDTLNQQRVERALALMDLQSQRVFHLIPALLHFNHPAIPGYFDADVPYGIDGQEFNDVQQQFIDDTELTLGCPLPVAKKPKFSACIPWEAPRRLGKAPPAISTSGCVSQAS